MKKFILLILSFLLCIQSSWARSKQTITQVEVEDQVLKVVSTAFKSGQRMMIISNEKCQRGDVCYRNNPIQSVVYVHHMNSDLTGHYVYHVEQGQLQWSTAIFQEQQSNGTLDIVIDRISSKHATAWSAFHPYSCDDQGQMEMSQLDLSEIE